MPIHGWGLEAAQNIFSGCFLLFHAPLDKSLVLIWRLLLMAKNKN
jgi:hypothetical protein